MQYRTDGDLYDLVCREIGWMPEVKAIKVSRRKNTVYVTGTLLKPQEWQNLQDWDGQAIGEDMHIKVVGNPIS